MPEEMVIDRDQFEVLVKAQERVWEQLKEIAVALESSHRTERVEEDVDEWLTKEIILRHTSNDELFALFHTFKNYLIPKLERRVANFSIVILDREIGEVIGEMKANYK